METNITKTLERLGLNEKEVKIYLSSLSMGQTSASILGSKNNITRSTAQYTCQSLVDKRLMNVTPKGNTFLYSPEPPEKLLSIINKEYTHLEKKMEDTHKIMGYLNNLSNPNAKLPKVKYYTGLDGIIDMFEDIFNVNETIYGALNIVDGVHPEFTKYLNEKYIPKRIKSNIHARGFVSDTENTRKYRENDEKMHKLTLLIPQKLYPFESCIHIYGNKVAFYSYSKNDMTGIIIENTKIRDTILSIFKMTWEFAKTLDVNKEFIDEKLIK